MTESCLAENSIYRIKLRYPVICIVGSTASGKTELAQNLALTLGDAEIISADSMQVYIGMDIGTAKLPKDARKVTYFGLDLISPGQPYSAALFQCYARNCFLDIDARNKRSILCGGSGFYIRAAIDGYEFPKGDQVNNPLREYFHNYAEENGSKALWDLLLEKDPCSAEIISPADTKRIIRAFELLEHGYSYSEQKRRLAEIPQVVPAVFIGLSVSKDILRKRIDKRVEDMYSAGLVEEVKNLLAQGFRSAITASQAIGYKEIVAALDGDISMDEALSAIKTATKRYAKRQRSWFRNDKRIHWLCADSNDFDTLTMDTLRILEMNTSYL